MKVGLFINTQFPEGCNLAERVPEMVAQVRAARDAGLEAGQPDDHRRGPRRPREPPLDGLEHHKPVWADIAVSNSRQHHHGYHRDPADPDHDGEHMQRPRDGDIIHDGTRLGSSADKGLLEKAEGGCGL
jgi:hypothetical protein